MGNKRKINKWDYVNLKRFCTANESTNKIKRQPTEWENIFANDTSDLELISKIYKELIHLNTKNQTVQLKNGQRAWHVWLSWLSISHNWKVVGSIPSMARKFILLGQSLVPGCTGSKNQFLSHSDVSLSPFLSLLKQWRNFLRWRQKKKWVRGLNRHFSKEDIHMAKRHIWRCLMSLITREMQIKATMRYHLPPVRMAVTNKSNNSAVKDVENGEPFCTVGGNADWWSHCGKQ